ncbi:type VI secretion system membrane subunit TssM [Escherichia coli]
MAMDLRDPNVWISHLLENLPEEKLASALKDDNPNWEYIDGEIVKLGSLAHSQLDIPELQRRGLVILASESKDFRLLAHLLRTLQHAGDPHLALRLLALYVEHYWAVAAPQNMAHKKRFASQVIKRFETGIEGFSQNAATAQRDALSGELAKLAQCWQSHNAPELAQATDDLFALYQRAFNRAAPAPVPTPAASGSSPQTTATSESGVTQPSAPAPQIVIDSHDDKAWRDTLLKVAAILCERQPDSPQGYRLRRHALWQNITSTPQAESDGRTPLAAVSADMVADYHAQLGSADMALWQQVEKSVLLAPYWLDGHCLSAQTALRLGYKQVADAIRDEVIRFLERLDRMNLALPDLMVAQTHTRASLFSFSRQMQGSREPLVSLLEGLLDGENMNVMLRGVYLTSSLQRGQMDDIFTQSAARQYRLGNNPLASWPLVDTAPYFTRSLFPQALLAEPNLATESRAWLIRSRRRLTVFSATGGVAALLLITGWHHYYNGNYQSGITVLKQAKAFMDVPPPQGEDDFGNLQLPLLNPVRDATLAYGDWGDRSRLADMGLYQGRRIGPYVEQTYLQLLEQRYLPSLFNGLVKAMNAAPPESEEKLAVLRVMRMLEDKSGRNNEVVKQYMAKRWSEKFHGQRDIQAQLMSHLDYALAHTDWHAERQAGDGDAISRWTPYDKPVVSAQKELSKLPVYQRVYQSLKTRALGVLPADINLRDQVGPTFDQVFTSADDNKLVVPQFLTRYGLQSYFVKQRDELVELTAMDSWVLNLTRNVKYSDADRAEIQHQLTEQYISDYTATWRAGMDNLNIRNFESIGQLTGALEQVISGDQPLQRALTVLRDNTQPGVFSEKLSAKEREEALAEPDYQLLTRLGHEFAPENSTLVVQKDKESTMQAVYQQLTELHRYLLAIQNAPVPGKSALKAVQLRLDQNSSDPIFATRQMAKTLPAPLNRWVGRLTDQAWHVVMVEAVHYMEVDWRDSVVKPFNEQLANNYPFNPRSAQDASLDAFERFFKPDGILDTFYQQNLKLFIDNDLSLEDGDNNVIIREDIIAQLETAQKIRDIFFSKQNGLGTSFAVETVSLSGNKRRSVLNLDGQLVDYSQGRNYTAHLVWPNNMREGNESKLTLIGTSGNAPRSISFSGPWAQFRLFGAGQLTGVQDGNFTVRFSVDGGAMTYRVHTDTEDNPFSGGLFSQFGLSDTLY